MGLLGFPEVTQFGSEDWRLPRHYEGGAMKAVPLEQVLLEVQPENARICRMAEGACVHHSQ